MLKVIIVWYNEELNLDKCLNSLSYLETDIKIYYIDQSSTDNSISIANKYTKNIITHDNKWYADPDKKWAVENIIQDNDWCLILDADETVSKELAKEICNVILSSKYKVYKIRSKVYYLMNSFVSFEQIRLFQKSGVLMTTKIHEYIATSEINIGYLKYHLINRDLRDLNNFIYNHIEKINRYSEKELIKLKGIWYPKILIWMFIKPFYIMIKWGLYKKLFFQWIPWVITTLNVSFYTFIIYAKLYEKLHNQDI